jgi:hypothetical protein
MPTVKSAARSHLFTGCILLIGCVSTGHSSVRVNKPAEFSSHKITCEFPVRLTHDCSIWQGATRPIAFGDYRMTLAAGSDGKTILLSRVRLGPDHNGYRFRPGPESKLGQGRSMRAIQCIGAVLENEGIRLERMQTVHQGHRVAGYFLEFSANAYDYLKQFTVLESEHWLPKRSAGR